MPLIRFQDKPNPSFKYFQEKELITITPKKIVSSLTPKVCIIGSCFSWRFKAYLKDYVECLPNWKVDEINVKKTMHLDMFKDPDYKSQTYLNHISHYTPASIYQELYRTFNYKKIDVEDYIIPIKGQFLSGKVNTQFKWQDIGRRYFISKEKQDLINVSHEISKNLFNSIKNSEIIFFSLETIEQFFLEKNNKEIYYNQHPNQYAVIPSDSYKYKILTLEEIKNYLEKMISIIEEFCPKKQIIFCVSPLNINIDRTTSQSDFYTFSLLAKSTLITALNVICKNSRNLHYFPSYEIANLKGRSFYDSSRTKGEEKNIYSLARIFIKNFNLTSNFSDEYL